MQTGDQDPKVLACYGLLRQYTGEMLRFVQGRPISAVTCDFLQCVIQELGKQGKKALLLIWDNVNWHISKQVSCWIKEYNRKAKATGGVRL